MVHNGAFGGRVNRDGVDSTLSLCLNVDIFSTALHLASSLLISRSSSKIIIKLTTAYVYLRYVTHYLSAIEVCADVLHC